ncbi:MAG: O-antigen ligase family protein [Oleibacter sp.]|nr:O-antigen ligase family protein [Thalassolituus sp.]
MRRWRAFQILVFVLPLPFGLNTNWTWPWVVAAVFWILGLELRGLLAFQEKKQLPNIVFPIAFTKALPLLGLLVLVQLWVIFQCLFGIALSPYDTQLEILLGFGYTAFFALSLLMIKNRKRLERIVWIVALAAAFQALYGSFMVMSDLEWGFFIDKEAYIGVATGTFINRNHLAGYLELSIALGIGLLISQSSSYYGTWQQRLRTLIKTMLSKKIILRLLLVIMVIAMVMTRSRMGNTAFFISLMTTGLLALLLMKNKTTSTSILLVSLLVVDIAIVGTFFGVDKLADRLQNSSTETESRDEVTRDTIAMAKTHALTGVGAGGFTYIYPAFRSIDVRTTRIYNNAHNDYSQFAAEFGLPASFALLVVVLVSIFWAISAMRLRNNDLHKGMGFAATMGIIALGIHSTVDFNLQIPANAFMFMLILSIAAIARWSPYSRKSNSANG